MDKRAQIIARALRLLVENGIHATPMSAIAKAANTGMGTIYHHFATKEALINGIYIDIKEKEAILLTQPIDEGSTQARFETYYTRVIHFYLENPYYFRFMQQLQHSPIITEESRQQGYQAIQPVIDILEEGQKLQVIKDISLEEILHFLGGTVFSYLGWALNDPSAMEKNSSLSDQLLMTWDGIKK